MRDLSNTKWLAASGGFICLAALLAASLGVHGAGTPRIATLPNIQGSTRVASLKNPAISANAAKLVRQYGQLPLAFEPNWSPASAPAKYLARGSGYTLFLASDEAVLELRGKSNTSAVVRMGLAGANAASKFTASEELPGKSNYFIGNDPKKWHTNIAQYRKVFEHDVYRGVDLVYYGTQSQLEYDFDVAPGIDPGVIRLAFQGAGNVQVDAEGQLVVNTAAGDVRMRKPIAYQEIGGVRQPVAVGYALKDEHSATFQIAQYDRTRPLVIDPILSYSTYLGGSNIDASNAIAVAPDNTAFIAGQTFSSDFPVVHALQINDGGAPDFPQDAFVSKISVDGSTLLYSTYLGGENRDFATGIAVDNFGNAYVTGLTMSPHFPVTIGSVNTECGGDAQCGASYSNGLLVSNAFVSKLNAAGSGLLYSTFLGEYENVTGEAIAVDANGNAYVAGQTENNFAVPPTTTDPPPNFPITPSAFQPTYGGGAWNAFITKIDATGSSVLYSSYYGGNTEDTAYGIVVDSAANAYITGLTYSSTLKTTAGALQAAYGGAGDAFAAKINTNGTGTASLVYSTYLGGVGLDQGSAIALDSSGNAYIAGLTNSATFGFTPAGFQPAYAGEGDAFVAKLSSAGALSYFTYLGGTLADSATGIAVDSTGAAYVTGTTVSQNFPTAGAVFQPTYGGGNADSFVAKLGPTGTTLVYSSYLGGTNTELASGIAVDATGAAYITGQTCSDDFPLSNPLQAVPGGNCDAYVAKVSILAGFAFNPAGLVFSAQSLNTTSSPQTITLTNGDSPQTISSIAVSGANPGDFKETTTCGSSLAVGATCTITVSFAPSANGIRKASLVITDSAPGSPHVVNLSGNTSTVTLSTSSLTFGNQQVGVASAAQTVIVTNSGTTPLTFTSVLASGDYYVTYDTCGNPIAPGTNCVIQVTFVPSGAFASIGAVTLTDSGSGSPQVILATGTGILVSQATVSPTSLTFGSQTVGTASSPKIVTLSNPGQAPLTISAITATGNFGQTNNCGASLAPGASCSISVTYTPTPSGTGTGLLTITDNATGSPQAVSLTGTAAAFVLSSSAPSAAVPAGQPATFSLTVSSTGAFGQAVSLACSVPASNATCAVSPSTVTPNAGAPQTATVTVTTGLRTMVPPSSNIKFDPFGGVRHFGITWLAWMLLGLAIIMVATLRHRPLSATFGFTVVLLLASVACSGGSSVGTPAGTPAGTYQVMVTGTSGSMTSSTALTLQVN